MYRILSLLVLFSAIVGCGSSQHAPVTELKQPKSGKKTYIVQPGDTLFGIAWRYDLDYKKMASANGISSPYRIFPGDILKLKESTWRPKSSSGQAKTEKSTKKTKSSSNTKQKKVEKTKGEKIKSVSNESWIWPVSGKIIRKFSPNTKLSKGIDIAGKEGTAIKSCRTGKVVYAGSQLKGYGNLIIIRHDDVYLSAYAHNRKILVKEGDTIKKGQVIAELGSTGTDAPKLHFEVRRNGKPIDPLSVLPKK